MSSPRQSRTSPRSDRRPSASHRCTADAEPRFEPKSAPDAVEVSIRPCYMEHQRQWSQWNLKPGAVRNRAGIMLRGVGTRETTILVDPRGEINRNQAPPSVDFETHGSSFAPVNSVCLRAPVNETERMFIEGTDANGYTGSPGSTT